MKLSAYTSIAVVLSMATVLFSVSSTAYSQIEVNAPVFNVGDKWTFDRILEHGNREQFSETIQVVAQDTLVVLLSESGHQRRFSRSMNPLEKDQAEVPRVRFPMTAGSKWEGDWEWTRNKGNLFGSHVMHWKVVAEETVEVPAGKIHALKIEGNGWVKDRSTINSVGGDIRSTETFWYAPSVKRIVKYQGKNLKWIPPQFIEVWSLSYELRSYELMAGPP